MDAPPAIARLYANEQQQQQSQHQHHHHHHHHGVAETPLNQTSRMSNANNVGDTSNTRSMQQQPQQQSQNQSLFHHSLQQHAPTLGNFDASANSHHMNSVVQDLRDEVRELKHRLAVAEENQRAAVLTARAETYLQVTRVLRSEGVGGVERMAAQYNYESAMMGLRGASMVGGGVQRATTHVAAPNVDSDVLTREELHSGLRKALRNL